MQWIHVKERPPQHGDEILATIYSNYKDKKFVTKLVYESHAWYEDNEILDSEYDVRYWMPWPEPAEGE